MPKIYVCSCGQKATHNVKLRTLIVEYDPEKKCKRCLDSLCKSGRVDWYELLEPEADAEGDRKLTKFDHYHG